MIMHACSFHFSLVFTQSTRGAPGLPWLIVHTLSFGLYPINLGCSWFTPTHSPHIHLTGEAQGTTTRRIFAGHVHPWCFSSPEYTARGGATSHKPEPIHVSMISSSNFEEVWPTCHNSHCLNADEWLIPIHAHTIICQRHNGPDATIHITSLG